MNRRRFIIISAAALGSGIIGVSPAKPKETVWSGRAFGSEAHILLQGDNATIAIEAALDTIRRMERYFSIYDPGSLLSELNKNGRLEMPAEFARLIAQVDVVHKNTEGLFDPTVQSLFLQKLSGRAASNKSTIGWHHVRRMVSQLEFAAPGMAMTLNGIAQGFATDRVSDVLSAHGFGSVVVNIGEYKITDKATSLVVENARGNTLGKHNLSSGAVATSSRLGFTFKDGSGHILRPDESPIPLAWETVSAVASTATAADGYSTALILAPDASLARNLIAEGLLTSVLLESANGQIIRL